MEELTSRGKLVETTASAEGTGRLGERLSRSLKGPFLNIFLSGGLGSGKTTLIKGLGRALGIEEKTIVSPTFQLVRRYVSPCLPVTHIDLYRLSDISEILSLGWYEMMEEESVTAVEWADRAACIWPEEGLFIFIRVLSDYRRRFTIYCRKKDVPGS